MNKCSSIVSFFCFFHKNYANKLRNAENDKKNSKAKAQNIIARVIYQKCANKCANECGEYYNQRSFIIKEFVFGVND